MRILLGESLPRRLGFALGGHDVSTVQQVGWPGFSNGKLIAQAAGKFDVLITGDQNLKYQQSAARLPVAT